MKIDLVKLLNRIIELSTIIDELPKPKSDYLQGMRKGKKEALKDILNYIGELVREEKGE